MSGGNGATIDRTCPLNHRKCDCDAHAADKKQHPCKLARRVGKFIRLLDSGFEGEAIASVTGLRRLAQTEGLVFSNLATLIENCNGEIEELKYSDADAQAIYARGMEKGRAERPAQEPTEFFDGDGDPCWYAIATHCRDNKTRLSRDWDKSFVDDVPSKIAGYGKPTTNQARQLLRIFVLLGGVVNPKVMQTFV